MGAMGSGGHGAGGGGGGGGGGGSSMIAGMGEEVGGLASSPGSHPHSGGSDFRR